VQKAGRVTARRPFWSSFSILAFEVLPHEVALKRDPTDCRPRLRIERVDADELKTENRKLKILLPK